MIPDGWELSIVGYHTDLLSGFAFKSKGYTNSHDGIRLLRGDNVAQGRLRWRDAKLWSRNKVENLDKFYLNKGDFIIAMDRTWIPAGVKVSQVQESDLPCLLVQRVSRLRAKPTLLQELLKQHFFSHRFEQYVKKVQTETAVPHISPTDIREFPILIPPLPEQKKIAQILSTWDKAIETVEKLIANSRQKKKALMQQLLTGKKRFPGFDGEWKEVRLENMCKIATGKKDVNEGNPHGLYPFYTCAIVPTKSDSYSFDCEAILIAGNGAIGTTHYYLNPASGIFSANFQEMPY